MYTQKDAIYKTISLKWNKIYHIKKDEGETSLQNDFSRVVNIDLTVPNVSCTPSMCLPITVVSSLNTQAASRLYLSINHIFNIYICLELFYGVRSSRNMSKHCADHLDMLLVKSMDFCEFLTILTEDLKIEEVRKDTKLIKSDIFQGFICYNPVRSAGLAKLRRDLTDKWF